MAYVYNRGKFDTITIGKKGEEMAEAKPLKQRILDEMGYAAEDMLNKCFEQAREVVRIRKDGGVIILNKERLDGQRVVLCYLLGKRYAYAADLSDTYRASVDELAEETGRNRNSIRVWLGELKGKDKAGILDADTGEGRRKFHFIKESRIEDALKMIQEKLNGGQSE